MSDYLRCKLTLVDRTGTITEIEADIVRVTVDPSEYKLSLDFHGYPEQPLALEGTVASNGKKCSLTDWFRLFK